ncbi:MAG: GDP-mannose 4,6-dehydratase [Balneolaceae bacterium]
MKKSTETPMIGILEWFHLGDKEHVLETIEQLNELGINELRTGISWADYHTSQGEEWLEWLIPTLAEHVKVLPCLLYTPPSIGVKAKTSSPPKYPDYFADFTDKFLQKYGEHFEWVELWNEPNNTSEYDFRYDPDWSVFKDMISWAAKEVRKHGKKVLLGGMSPIDPGWIDYMYKIGLMDSIDAVGIHGFPDVFDSKWLGWQTVIEQVEDVIKKHKGNQKIWITETGYSTWKNDEQKQFELFLNILQLPVERVYWYSLNDLSPNHPTVDGFHIDDREYYFGMVTDDNRPKLLYRLLKNKGLENINEETWLSKSYTSIPKNEKYVLITGGAGFIGTNVADYFLSKGKAVTIYDNLSRPGVEKNINWLKNKYPENLNIRIADIRNKYQLQEAVDEAEFVYHFAAQVAVTTSYTSPEEDFDINVHGTLNVLEAIRKSANQPPVAYTSTNKVYGNLPELNLQTNHTRYYVDHQKISEDQELDFYSPYGCSKGAADAYVLDYSRIYDLKTVVFRMSCIYGPHQFGTEDQGWVAHFLIQALKGNPLTIFGDGKQVRDILFVEDLVNAFSKVYEHIGKVSGEAYNIGGGLDNTVSLNELILRLETLIGEEVPHSYDEWRPGDQKYYVSDVQKFQQKTGWTPKTDINEGLIKLYEWLTKENVIEPSENEIKIHE